MNVHVTTKAENAIVGLREVQPTIGFVICFQKCKLSRVSKTHSYCNVLVLGASWVKGSENRKRVFTIMLDQKWFGESKEYNIREPVLYCCAFSLTPSHDERVSNRSYPCTS